jgi:hypothetical protein
MSTTICAADTARLPPAPFGADGLLMRDTDIWISFRLNRMGIKALPWPSGGHGRAARVERQGSASPGMGEIWEMILSGRPYEKG